MADGPDTDELLRRINQCNDELHLIGLNITSLPELPSGLKHLYCYNTPLILQRDANESISDYNARWNEWRELEMSKKRCQERSRIIRDDLCAMAWRPERVQKWLEIGGFDLIDAL